MTEHSPSENVDVRAAHTAHDELLAHDTREGTCPTRGAVCKTSLCPPHDVVVQDEGWVLLGRRRALGVDDQLVVGAQEVCRGVDASPRPATVDTFIRPDKSPLGTREAQAVDDASIGIGVGARHVALPLATATTDDSEHAVTVTSASPDTATHPFRCPTRTATPLPCQTLTNSAAPSTLAAPPTAMWAVSSVVSTWTLTAGAGS